MRLKTQIRESQSVKTSNAKGSFRGPFFISLTTKTVNSAYKKRSIVEVVMLVKTHVLSLPKFVPPLNGPDTNFLISIHPSGTRLLAKTQEPSNLISSIDGSYLAVVLFNRLPGKESLIDTFEGIGENVLGRHVQFAADVIDYGTVSVLELLEMTRIENKISEHSAPVYRAEAVVDLSTGDLNIAVPYLDSISIKFCPREWIFNA